MLSTFDAISANSRLWIFPLASELAASEADTLTETLRNFFEEWDSHGASVVGAFSIAYRRFLLVAADQESCSVSGCSIDGLFRAVQERLRELGLVMANLADVFYLEEDTVCQLSRAAFKEQAARGENGPRTLVFDTSVQTVSSVRDGSWILPREHSWHEKLVA